VAIETTSPEAVAEIQGLFSGLGITVAADVAGAAGDMP
jgi:hypothetical protein